ncbi:ABC transporter ATP-binding protein [Effusibacillus dendaii]|uniref:ABC transporter domain-containing protein n=1 Tax=Effusibacillus dendaii TaxID=2743772 RepID=A0A7I8DCW3_9BACL|nr:ABC transporter ATP-binding protein [Effusibacillus dendaii]BCJ87122.1 hypothetical protein skT53_21070 [Effusibacillus dendaii]
MITAQNINWRVRKKIILQNIDFSLQKGELAGLVGPNGSGKSSLLKILSFLQRPTSGTIQFQGMPVGNRVSIDIRRKIAVVFQEPLLFNTTVFENVASGLKMRRTPKDEIRLLCETWLNRFGVGHVIEQHARSLSGGEAQRVSLARAFVLDPDVLFLDEPFSALDAPAKESLVTDLQSILQTTGTTTVLVSHDYRDILRLANRALVMQNGRLIADGAPLALLNHPPNEQVADFLRHWRNFPETVDNPFVYLQP